jgi:hypothetical protein
MSPPNNNKENGVTRVVSRKYTLEVVTYKKTISVLCKYTLEVVTYKKTVSALCVSTFLEPCEKCVF